MKYSGVVGVGLDSENNVVICVKEKTQRILNLLPLSVEGYPVKVIETGKFFALNLHNDKWRPAPGGVSIGHYKSTAGTLSTIVYDKDTGEQFILSNNHVLAESSTDVKANAEVGDRIMQPGPADMAHAPWEVIGTLHTWIPVNQTRDNTVDCALAKPANDSVVSNQILGIGLVSTYLTRDEYIRGGFTVQKSGRTTEVTEGTVHLTDLTLDVDFGDFTARFIHQIMIERNTGAFTLPGDSGSLVVTMDNKAVGLVFAGSALFGYGIANPIYLVLDSLNIELPDYTYNIPQHVRRHTEHWVKVTCSFNGRIFHDADIYLNENFVASGEYYSFISAPGSYRFTSSDVFPFTRTPKGIGGQLTEGTVTPKENPLILSFEYSIDLKFVITFIVGLLAFLGILLWKG